MADAFIGEIRIFPYMFNPNGWFPCDGRQIMIGSYQALYSLLGTRYGGDGKTTFNVPNLNGNIPVGAGTAVTGTVYTIAKTLGTTTVTLTYAQTPPHFHTMSGRVSTGNPATTGMTGGPNTAAPLSMLSRAVVPGSPPKPVGAYSNTGASDPTTYTGVNVAPSGGTPGGGGPLSHPNVMPSLVMGYFINWDGVYPVNPN